MYHFQRKVDDEDLYFIEEIIKESFDMSKTTSMKIPVIKKDDIKINCNHSTNLASMQIITKETKRSFLHILLKYLMILISK